MKVLHTVPRGMAADVNAAVACAKTAFANGEWASLTAVQRAEKVVQMVSSVDVWQEKVVRYGRCYGRWH